MKIGVLKERVVGETRAALTPDVVASLVKDGFTVYVEKDLGKQASLPDEAYSKAGAKVSAVPLEIVSDADIILKVQPSPLGTKINEIDLAKKPAIIIGLLNPHGNTEYFNKVKSKRMHAIAMELVPRTTIAQGLDTLSSQSNLAGYRAVLEASYHFSKALPMMMTAAGTITPAKVLILGVGVAGLQAIATAKRLGAVVSAYDVRPATREQVQSLGGKFIFPPELEKNEAAEAKSGYAKEMDKDFNKIQEQFLGQHVPKFDIIITTAQIPGKSAPLLLSQKMVASMKAGSVIVDMATSSGGNVAGSKQDAIVTTDGSVKIIGYSNLATQIAQDSSKLYAKNLYNLLKILVSDNKINFDNDIIKQMLVTKAANSAEAKPAKAK